MVSIISMKDFVERGAPPMVTSSHSIFRRWGIPVARVARDVGLVVRMVTATRDEGDDVLTVGVLDPIFAHWQNGQQVVFAHSFHPGGYARGAVAQVLETDAILKTLARGCRARDVTPQIREV